MAIHEDQTEADAGLSSRSSAATDFETAQGTIFEEAGLRPQSTYLDIQHPSLRLHYHGFGEVNAEQPPLVMLHSGGTFGASFAPMMEHLGKRHIVAIDRPGYGLSGDFVYTADNYRQTALAVLDGVIDDLDVGEVDLVGNSAGGYWSLAYALSQPERVRRIAIVGSVPTFPGTSAPFPLRMFTLPLMAKMVSKLQPPSRQSVVKQYELFGEAKAIQEHPALIEAIVAQQRRSRSVEVDTSEFKSLLRLRGWNHTTRFGVGELNDIAHPSLFIWGDDDPLGRPGAVRDVIGGMPRGQLEELTGVGHVPWLGEPERCAELVSRFIEREAA